MTALNAIEQAVARHAATRPSQPALEAGGNVMTYAELDHAITVESRGIGPLCGRALPLRAKPCLEFVVCYLAVHRAGGVAVPLGEELPAAPFIELSERLAAAPVPSGTADILFTTGTTGRPKGVMLSHRAMMADADNLVAAQGYHPGLTFVTNGPLNHIGTLSKLWPTFLAGGTVRITPGMKDIRRFITAIDEARGPVATFAVPAALRMLMTFAEADLRRLSPRIEFIETGAAPMAEADMQRLRALLPTTRLYNTYASTETGIIATHDYQAGPCQAGCLGHPMRHSSLRIDGEGRVVCSGATLMTGYWQDEAATRSLLGGGELRTADLGRLDAEGRLHLTGRTGDVINVGGYKVAPTDVENAARAVTWVTDCLCVPFAHPVAGTALRLLVECDAEAFDARALLQALRQRLEPHQCPADIRRVDSIRRTYNGKPDRKAYL